MACETGVALKRKRTLFQSLGRRSAILEGEPAIPYARSIMAGPSIEALYLEIRSTLLARRQRLAEEISRHPRPITACDVHFNGLLEERALLSEELERFDEFVVSSACLTPEAKSRIRA